MKRFSRLLACMMALFMVLSLMPTTVMAEDSNGNTMGGVTFVPVDMFNEYDVQVNGVGPIVTIYCLQQKNLWPTAAVVYYDKREVTEGFEFGALLTDPQVQILRKLVYAGYPYDSQGILRENWFYGEAGGMVTNVAIWTLMSEWEKTGSDPGQSIEVLKQALEEDPEDFFSEAVLALIDYALDDTINIDAGIDIVDSNNIELSGDTVFHENPDGTYATGELKIVKPEGVNLLFELELPQGVEAQDESGWSVEEIGEQESFILVAESRDAAASVSLNVSAHFTYPGDISFFVTNQETGRYNQVDHTPQLWQTMLYITEESKDISASFEINRDDQAVVEIKGSKTWDDNEDQDGKRPEEIVVELHANGVKVDSKTVRADDGWSWDFGSQPMYKDGGLVTYTLVEQEVDDYTTHYHGFNITNSYTPGKTSITVEKEWFDDNNRDGIRPSSVTVRLLADGVDTQKTITLNAEGNWEGEFEDLDEYANGERIVYTIEEVTVDGYTCVISGSAHEGFEIANTHAPETVEVSGKKIWDDAGDQDGKRPESITIRLHADGVEKDSVTVTADDNWEWTFSNLKKYDQGTEIVYTVTEDEVKDYSTTYDPHSYDITNTYTPGKVSITVSKTWDDDHDRDGIRPDSVTIKLHIHKESGSSEELLILTVNDRWEGGFSDLDEYSDGKKIIYTISEVPVEGYHSLIHGNETTGYTVANHHTPDKVIIEGEKVWDDDDNQDGKRPEDVTVRIHANGVEIRVLTISAATEWKWKVEDLPKNENGHAITYTVTEDEVTDYSTAYSTTHDTENGIYHTTITNSYTPGQTSITVEKSWEDNFDQDGIRPESVTVRLLINGEAADPDKTLVLSEENDWIDSFTELDVYEDGRLINYTVEEVDVAEGYSASLAGDSATGFTLVNTHEPEKVSISVTKAWDDADDQDGIRPEEVVICLLANGEPTGHEIKLNADNRWGDHFDDLDKYKDGELIEYTVEEKYEVTGYTASVEKVEGTTGFIFTVTNKHEVTEESDSSDNSESSDNSSSDNSESSDNSSSDNSESSNNSSSDSSENSSGSGNSGSGTPDTGDHSQSAMWVLMALAAMLGVIGLTAIEKRRLRKN